MAFDMQTEPIRMAGLKSHDRTAKTSIHRRSLIDFRVSVISLRVMSFRHLAAQVPLRA